jgi:hypothetical protein
MGNSCFLNKRKKRMKIIKRIQQCLRNTFISTKSNLFYKIQIILKTCHLFKPQFIYYHYQ